MYSIIRNRFIPIYKSVNRGERQVDVKGRKAIIFGGTSGIGLAASKQLAELGATVVAVSREPKRAGEVPDLSLIHI